MVSDWPELFWSTLEAGKLGYKHERQLPLFLILESMCFVPLFLFIHAKQTCYISHGFAAAG